MLKKIFSNTIAQLVAKFFGAGLTLLTTYYTIRLAGLDLYGDLTKILVLVAVGFTAIDFGLNAEGLRSSRTEPDMHRSLGIILLTRLLLSCLIIGILNLVIIFLPGGYSPEVKSVFWLGSLAIIFQGIYTSGNAWFQYKLSYWRSTISVVVGSLIGTILTFYYLKYAPSLSNFVLATTLGYLSMAVTTLLLLPLPLRSFDIRHSLFSVLPLLRRSLPLGLILITSVIAAKIDTILLGIFRLSGEVGQYGFAYRIFDVILVLPVFVMNAIYPLSLRENLGSGRPTLIDRTAKYLALIGALTAIFAWQVAPFLSLVKPGLTVSISVLRILALALPLFYVTAPLMWGLIAQKRDKAVLLVYSCAVLINFLLNCFFIPSFGAVAAAWNTLLTELFIFVALLYYSYKPVHNS